MPNLEDGTDRRKSYAAWLTANGINPTHVLLDADVYIETASDGTRCIVYEACQLDAQGRKQINERGDGIALERRTAPLLVEPPDWWEPYVKPTRDQLMSAIGKAAPTIRKALKSLPTACRYHGDRLEPHQPSYGREACCDTGEPAMRRRKAEDALKSLAAHLETGQL